MEPIIESHWLYKWQGANVPEEESADPSLRQLRESRLREGLAFESQPAETQRLFQQQAVRIGTALLERKGEIRFRLPERIVWPEAGNGEGGSSDVPVEFREQIVAGFLNRIPAKDIRSAFRGRLAQLENSGYSGVRAGAALLRFAVVRHIVHDLIPEKLTAGLPAADFLFPQDGEGYRPWAVPEAPDEKRFLQDAEGALPRLRDGLSILHQAVSLAPYMFADKEYQAKRDVLLARLLSLGHAVADGHIRNIVRTIRRRADADDLNRGLRLSVPYFDDRALEMKLHEFEVIPPGRTMFVPAFVALAAAREQEKIGQENSLSSSTRMHLLAGLKSLEQAFDLRPR
jgi:hypothetical protein